MTKLITTPGSFPKLSLKYSLKYSSIIFQHLSKLLHTKHKAIFKDLKTLPIKGTPVRPLLATFCRPEKSLRWRSRIIETIKYISDRYLSFSLRLPLAMKLHNCKKLRGSKTTKYLLVHKWQRALPFFSSFPPPALVSRWYSIFFYLIKFISLSPPLLSTFPQSPFVVTRLL